MAADQLVQNLGAVIGRAIVDDDDLIGRAHLGGDAAKALREIAGMIIVGHH
jgi:hypothetical protein